MININKKNLDLDDLKIFLSKLYERYIKTINL